MTKEHIAANNWKDGEEFTPEGLWFRFSNGDKDKVHAFVSVGIIDGAIYRNHVI
jgi:hypothetical protein